MFSVLISSAAHSTERLLDNLLTDHDNDIQSYNLLSNTNSKLNQNKLGSTNFRTNKLVAKTGRFAQRVREHVRLGLRISETPKGKLSLGAKILWFGGVRKLFNQKFNSREGEKLTEGPVAGLLFGSTDKVAFCSER